MTDGDTQLTERFAALGQPTRLAVFRTLVAAGDEGMAAGRIATAIGIAPNTLSSHLSILSKARLLTQRRDGRSIYYAVDTDGLQSMCETFHGLCGHLLEPFPTEILGAAAGGNDLAKQAGTV